MDAGQIFITIILSLTVGIFVNLITPSIQRWRTKRSVSARARTSLQLRRQLDEALKLRNSEIDLVLFIGYSLFKLISTSLPLGFVALLFSLYKLFIDVILERSYYFSVKTSIDLLFLVVTTGLSYIVYIEVVRVFTVLSRVMNIDEYWS